MDGKDVVQQLAILALLEGDQVLSPNEVIQKSLIQRIGLYQEDTADDREENKKPKAKVAPVKGKRKP
jgi:hypothetical protein